MSLFLVQHLLVFISVLSLATSASIPRADLSFDPCKNYTVLDNSWRAVTNLNYNQDIYKLQTDCNVNFAGWYRLFVNGQSVKMPDTCVDHYGCATHNPLWLSGGHPAVGDGVVTRNICGSTETSCCGFQSTPINVTACPGGYYVYELVQPSGCDYSVYCAESISVTPDSTSPEPDIFYPFGSAAGDTNNPPQDDGSSSGIQLLSPFKFFGRSKQTIYVNNNGFLTFTGPSLENDPTRFSAGSEDLIAGLWTDIDNRAKGVISYNQYTSGDVLTRATQDINNHFQIENFSASWVFVATWKKVAYYAFTNTETSFQVVLISGTNYSFLLMNYGDVAPPIYNVEAGFLTLHSTNDMAISVSSTRSLSPNLNSSSNVYVPGLWSFRVDGGPNLTPKVPMTTASTTVNTTTASITVNTTTTRTTGNTTLPFSTETNKSNATTENSIMKNTTVLTTTLTNGTGTNSTGSNNTVKNGTVTHTTGTNGTVTNGTGTNGSGTNGTVTNGTGTNGTVTNGTVTNGTGTNGSGTNGTVTNGTGTNGTGTNGTVTNTTGTAEDGVPKNGSKGFFVHLMEFRFFGIIIFSFLVWVQ